MRVECWGGPWHGRIVDVPHLPWLVPLQARRTCSIVDSMLDSTEPTFRVGRYDTRPGNRTRVYYEGP